MLTILSTFSHCNLPLPCSATTLARLGYVFNIESGSVMCSKCEFVVDLQSYNKKDYNYDSFKSIQFQHKSASPDCPLHSSEMEQLDSGYGSATGGYSNWDTGGASKEPPGKNGKSINVFTIDLDEIFPNGTSGILKKTLASMRARILKREEPKNVDAGQTMSGSDSNVERDTTDYGSPISRVPQGPTATEIQMKSKHPGLAFEAERRKTFNGQERRYAHLRLPGSIGDKIKRFVDSGFYYTGPDDNVRCFFCDGGLVNFRDEDDPWAEHKRWYPDCLYMKYRENFGPSMQRDGLSVSNNSGGSLQRTAVTPANVSSLPVAPVRTLDSREIKARLETPMIQTLLRLGYQREHIRRALERRLTFIGDDFHSVEELVNDILEAEGDAALPKPSQNAATARAAGNQGATNLPSQSHVGGINGIGSSSTGSVTGSSVARTGDIVDGTRAAPAVTAAQVVRDSAANDRPGNRSHAVSLISAAEAFASLKNSNVQDQELKSIMTEYEQLTQIHTCKMCLESEINTVFLPCGHFVSCHTCAPKITHCCICRSLIRGTVRALITDFDSERCDGNLSNGLAP